MSAAELYVPMLYDLRFRHLDLCVSVLVMQIDSGAINSTR